jgi:CubicO group peptidase (beta-lactamase class C family)
MKNFLSLSLIIFFVFSIGIGACQSEKKQTVPEDVDDRIELIENGISAEGRKWSITERMEALKIPGVSIGVIHNFKLDWAKGYGYADLAEKREVTESTLFQAASISKSLTGVGVLKLAQENKVKLNEDVNSYLKSWKFPYDENSGEKKITLLHLLSHSAGLNVHGFRGYRNGAALPTVVQILNGEAPANSEAVHSLYAPGTKMQYSGGGTTIAQLLVTDISGKNFSEFMKDEVLGPLEMTTSFYNQPGDEKKPVLATGYLFDKSEVPGKYQIHPEEGAASLWTNPTDLSKYIIETQLALKGKSSKVLNQQNTKLRLTPVHSGAGLGVFLQTIGKGEYFQHGGANEGFRALYIGDFEKGNGAVIMVNSENNKIIQEILLTVANVYQWDGYYDSGIKLSEEKLKDLAGYYQAAFNSDLYLQIVATEKQLMLRQLWDGKEIYFEAQSELEFLNKEISFPLKFSRNSRGEIAEVLAFNRDVWKRDDTFVPKIRKAIQLSREKLKAFEGKYQVRNDKNLFAQVTAKEKHLLIKTLWDGKEMMFVPETEVDFFVKDNQYSTIKFVKSGKGEVKEIIAFGTEVLDKVE